MWVDAPQVGNFCDQKWGISVIAVTAVFSEAGGSAVHADTSRVDHG